MVKSLLEAASVLLIIVFVAAALTLIGLCAEPVYRLLRGLF